MVDVRRSRQLRVLDPDSMLTAMPIPEVIQSLVDRPREGLSVELKDWIDPQSPEGVAKLAKACIALRNFNGGYLVIGFSDNGTPNAAGAPADIEATFHVDTVQAIITKYASEPFEVTVHFPELQGCRFPVLEVPSGFKVPVATKADLASDGTHLIRKDRIYVRSLNASNVPSTTIAGNRDWKDLVERCFDNREADIARFVRRHLSNITPEVIQQLLTGLTQVQQLDQRTSAGPHEFLEWCHERLAERNLPPWGQWEIAAVIKGDVPPHSSNQTFLQTLMSSNPRYTGWPVWIDSRQLTEGSNPQVFDGGWEAMILLTEGHPSLDFWRIEPAGRFYLLRSYQDDTERPPGQVLDFALVILRTAEAVAVALRFARAMGCDPETTFVEFAFRWNNLAGRQLSAWANPRRALGYQPRAEQDYVLAQVEVPLDAPDSALGGYVHQVTSQLFNVFEGMEFDPKVTEDLTTRLLGRRL